MHRRQRGLPDEGNASGHLLLEALVVITEELDEIPLLDWQAAPDRFGISTLQHIRQTNADAAHP